MKYIQIRQWLTALLLLVAALVFTGCHTEDGVQPHSSQTTVEESAQTQHEQENISQEKGRPSSGAQSEASASASEQENTPVQQALTGVWSPVSATVDGQDAPQVALNSGVSYRFAADGSFTMLIHGQSAGTGTYTVNGKEIICEMDGATQTFAYRDGTLRTQYNGGSGLVITVYEKTGS